eukprot:8673697-Alexandrium_andersonii.AAC.1
MTGSPTFADSEPRRWPFGPLGMLGPRPFRAGFGAKCLSLTQGSGGPVGVPTRDFCGRPPLLMVSAACLGFSNSNFQAEMRRPLKRLGSVNSQPVPSTRVSRAHATNEQTWLHCVCCEGTFRADRQR